MTQEIICKKGTCRDDSIENELVSIYDKSIVDQIQLDLIRKMMK